MVCLQPWAWACSGFDFCRNGANDRRAEGGRPLTENEPGPAGCGVHEEQVDLDRCPVQNLVTAVILLLGTMLFARLAATCILIKALLRL